MRWVLLLVTAAGLAGCRDAVAPAAPREVTAAAGASSAAQERTLTVRVTGHEYSWQIRYPGPDGLFETPDDVLTRRHIHLPASSRITVDLRSDDNTYLFYVPALDVMEPAIREMPFDLELRTRDAGSFELRGGQMCGFAHEELAGTVEVEAPEAFDAWLATAGK